MVNTEKELSLIKATIYNAMNKRLLKEVRKYPLTVHNLNGELEHIWNRILKNMRYKDVEKNG